MIKILYDKKVFTRDLIICPCEYIHNHNPHITFYREFNLVKKFNQNKAKFKCFYCGKIFTAILKHNDSFCKRCGGRGCTECDGFGITDWVSNLFKIKE